MIESTREIVDDILYKMNSGVVTIGDEKNGQWKYYVKCQNNISEKASNDSKSPMLIIPNMEVFIDKIDKYLLVASDFYSDDKDYFGLESLEFQKKLFLDILLNMTNFDTQNVLGYIDNKIELITKSNVKIGQKVTMWNGLKVQTTVSKTRSNLEGPYKYTTAFVSDNGDHFDLPAVTFGINDSRVYVYSVQGKKTKQENVLSKKLDRYFRKVNKDVDMESLLGQVSPNALVAFTIFISSMKEYGCTDVVAPDFMPLRYNGNKISGYIKSSSKEEAKEFAEKHDRDQYNITNKLMYLFLRYSHHFDGCTADFDIDQNQMSMVLSNDNSEKDNIIFELDKIMSQSNELAL